METDIKMPIYKIEVPEKHGDGDKWLDQYRFNHNLTNIWKYWIDLQIENQHLKDHLPKKLGCSIMIKDEDDESISYPQCFCYPDIEKIICPRCLNYDFKGYSVTDENDTYVGFKCQSCNLDYSISH